ncbi:(3S,6E)-nerolidol synthase 1-like [Argentina anserina]|uniref:(3S,6E)-nerolidol synthase 1-like n=1 Tax=Argentina anserina TaxID=57926 RepID=UPI0021767D06|nr:(3S,6E)-nerolidol synthase 1-like [Potentilla anserina]
MALSLQPHSATSKSQTGDFHVRHEQKLTELKEALANADQLQQLVVIDAMQRLGVAYRFQEDIDVILEKQYTRSSAYYNGNDDGNHQLLEASLRFRLFRQQGFPITLDADVKNKIKNNQKLNAGLVAGEDIEGLVELCEASHLSFQGEEALEEAGKLCRKILTAWVLNNHNDCLATLVANTLEHPYHKSLTRFTAKKFLNSFQGQENWVCSLQELAKLEFNMVESTIRNEILQVSRWWKELGLTKELKFVRDQPIKWYTWPMACLVDPRLSVERVELTKAISLVYIIDDIFDDVHGSLDELVLFTAAVARWDTATNDELPNYMKTCFKALNDITNDISERVYENHGWNPIDTLRESWARLCKAFLVEAQWLRHGQLPSSEDYLRNGIISSGVPAVLTNAFFILGQGITKETIDLFNSTELPSIVSSTATILRLWDDFGSAMDEEQNGYDGSYIEFYMKEHQGSTVEEAQGNVIRKISDEWKNLNQECFSCNPFSESFTQLALNVSRMVPMMYDYNDNHRLPSLEENMKSLLLDSFLAKGITHG